LSNQIIVGKRVPIGAAVNGLVLFSGEIWNITHPEVQLSMAVVGGLAVTLTMLVQILVVNLMGVTHVGDDKE
jgi:hypothetical protein